MQQLTVYIYVHENFWNIWWKIGNVWAEIIHPFIYLGTSSIFSFKCCLLDFITISIVSASDESKIKRGNNWPYIIYLTTLQYSSDYF